MVMVNVPLPENVPVLGVVRLNVDVEGDLDHQVVLHGERNVIWIPKGNGWINGQAKLATFEIRLLSILDLKKNGCKGMNRWFGTEFHLGKVIVLLGNI